LENNNNISDPFNTPEGYFNRSKASILNKAEWLSEHEGYPTLLALKGRHGFVVPEQYFDMNTVKLELLDLPNLSAITKQTHFTVPDTYFEKGKSELANTLELQDELSEFKTLNALPKTIPFEVSATYFEESKVRLKQANTSARIISIKHKPVWLAAAAVLTIVLSVWVYNAFFNVPVVIDEDCHTLACIEKRDLLKYKLDNLDNEDLYDLVNTEKLEKKLNTTNTNDSLKTSDSIDASILDYME